MTTEHETKTVMEEFGKIAGDIRYLREEPLERHKTDSTMTIDKMTCGSCAFQPLCKLYLQGQNESRTMRMLYTHNDYVDQYREQDAS